MRVRTKQKITIGLSLGLALLVGATLLVSTWRVVALVQDNLANGRIVETLTNMRFLGVQYVTYGEDRVRTQWLTQDARLRQLLHKGEYDPEVEATRDSIRRNHAAARNAFLRIVEVRARFAANPGDQSALAVLQDRLYSQLVAKSLDMTSGAFHLSRAGYERIEKAKQIANVLTMIFVLLMIGIIAANAHLITRGILRPLRNIQDGAGRVGGGDFEHRIGIATNDEIGDLAGAFDAMTLRLHQTRTSLAAAEETQRAQANLMEAVFNNMHDGLSIVDADLNIVRVNPAARRFLGLEPDDPLPAKWTDIKGRYRPDRVTLINPEELQVVRVMRGEPMSSGELFMINDKHPQGLCLESVTKSIAGATTLVAALVIWHDVTAARRAADDITRLNQGLALRAAELETANKDLEAFSYSVSHDLRAPLRAIDGFSRLILENPQGGDTLHYLQRVRTNAQQMGTLIDDLLAFSRLGRQQLSVQSVSTAALVRQCLDTLRAADGGGRVASAAVSVGELPVCSGDPGLLREVWMNLLSNAFKFSGKHAAPRIEIGASATANGAVYFVRDNGAGFDMRYTDKLFGVFQRLHTVREFPGTGVGLALVQRIVQRHGGRIWPRRSRIKAPRFISRWEKIMFKAELPIEILLVEDNPDDEELTLRALHDNHLVNTLHVVRDGEEAIEFLSCSGRYAGLDPAHGTPKVILLDLKLPKVSGIEVLQHIKRDPRLHAVPVVVLTSSHEERDIVDTYALGVNSYIVKPVTFEQFTEAVRQVGMYWLLLNQPPVPPRADTL